MRVEDDPYADAELVSVCLVLPAVACGSEPDAGSMVQSCSADDHDLVSEVVDHLDGDTAGGWFVEWP